MTTEDSENNKVTLKIVPRKGPDAHYFHNSMVFHIPVEFSVDFGGKMIPLKVIVTGIWEKDFYNREYEFEARTIPTLPNGPTVEVAGMYNTKFKEGEIDIDPALLPKDVGVAVRPPFSNVTS